MLRKCKNKRGQAIISEYGMAIIVVIAAMVAMTVYFKRAVQARIRDANVHMMQEVGNTTGGQFKGALYYEYEPYYTETSSTVSSTTNRGTTLSGGGTTGIFQKNTNDTRNITVSGQTLPPKDFKNTDK